MEKSEQTKAKVGNQKKINCRAEIKYTVEKQQEKTQELFFSLFY